MRNIKIWKNPISVKNKIRLFIFNKKSKLVTMSFRNSISRYSNIFTSNYDIKQKTFKKIKNKKKLFLIFNILLKSKNWFLIDSLVQEQTFYSDLNFISDTLFRITNKKPLLFKVDKIFLNYLKKKTNLVNKDFNKINFFVGQNFKSNDLKILPFSPDIENLLYSYLTFFNTSSQVLKNFVYHSDNNNFFYQPINQISTQKILIVFEDSISIKYLCKIYQFLYFELHSSNFSFFYNGYFFENFYFQKNNHYKKNLNNSLINLFFNLNKLQDCCEIDKKEISLKILKEKKMFFKNYNNFFFIFFLLKKIHNSFKIFLFLNLFSPKLLIFK